MSVHDEIRIHIIATSDMHSQILNESERSNIYRAGTYINEVRQKHQHVVLVDNGGNLAGSITAFYYAIIAPYKRHPMIKLMNAMNYDASGMSENEFKYGLDFFNRSAALSRFPWLSANVVYAVTHEPYFSTPYTVKYIEGLKLVVIGLSSEGLMRNENIEMESEVMVESATFAAQRWIQYIYETIEPDFLIVLYHGGLSKLSHSHDAVSKNQAEEIMRKAGMIDLMITGHQHEMMIENDGTTLFVQAGQNAETVVHVKAHFRKRRNSFELLKMEPKIVTLTDYPEAQDLLNLTYYDRKAIWNWKNEYVTSRAIDMHFDTFHDLISTPQMHPYIQLLHQSLYRETDIPITCVHLPLPHATGLKGQLKNEDIYYSYPHPDKPIHLTLKGADILRLIETSVAHLTQEEGKWELRDTDPTHFLFWSGFDYVIDVSQPSHQRVTKFELRHDFSYRVVTTDYIYRHYRHLLTRAIVHQTLPITMPELLVRELRTFEDTSVPLAQNMQFKSYR
ncbi:bifunctional metallophosphatase/5'-nucleotidase [Staphylococcus lutrae]|uniref:Bifunctional metallophosphatase/5'-nucleotidase n=1 Tax=Staphylococcus lutrae TaxID=155085 RepID=A0AAC9WJL4_9STAP|nr:bifunctional UDP-sugar hydrolase/5'-nucleotidase [Staphylococcus lutrae]ARJ51464.1 bifunctional metallophosphatase/5'-nucleotidase [Staphylococcus lutrae]PNZ37988.1 bifunctional metallophosphatase/5'-nucleotidase [Staphylococcus lutrae]